MTTQLSAHNMTQKLMINGMRRSYSKFKIQKNKTCAKRCSSNLIIHFTLTPTHMGTKHKTAVVNHTQLQNFFILFSFL